MALPSAFLLLPILLVVFVGRDSCWLSLQATIDSSPTTGIRPSLLVAASKRERPRKPMTIVRERSTVKVGPPATPPLGFASGVPRSVPGGNTVGRYQNQLPPGVKACQEGDVLRVTFEAGDKGDGRLYANLANVGFHLVQDGDVFEYEIMWNEPDCNCGAEYEAGSTYRLRDHAPRDGQGYSPHSERNGNMSGVTYKRWYKRRWSMEPVIGRYVDKFVLSAYVTAGATRTAFLRLWRIIKVTNGAEEVRKAIFSDGGNSLIANSYFPGTVTTSCQATTIVEGVTSSVSGLSRSPAAPHVLTLGGFVTATRLLEPQDDSGVGDLRAPYRVSDGNPRCLDKDAPAPAPLVAIASTAVPIASVLQPGAPMCVADLPLFWLQTDPLTQLRRLSEARGRLNANGTDTLELVTLDITIRHAVFKDVVLVHVLHAEFGRQPPQPPDETPPVTAAMTTFRTTAPSVQGDASPPSSGRVTPYAKDLGQPTHPATVINRWSLPAPLPLPAPFFVAYPWPVETALSHLLQKAVVDVSATVRMVPAVCGQRTHTATAASTAPGCLAAGQQLWKSIVISWALDANG